MLLDGARRFAVSLAYGYTEIPCQPVTHDGMMKRKDAMGIRGDSANYRRYAAAGGGWFQ